MSENAPLPRSGPSRIEAFLRALPADLPRAQVKPDADGGFLVLWYNAGGDLVEIDLAPDGCVVSGAFAPRNAEFGRFGGAYAPGGEARWEGGLPAEAERMLRRLWS